MPQVKIANANLKGSIFQIYPMDAGKALTQKMPIKTVTVKGILEEERLVHSPYSSEPAITILDSKDWEAVLAQYSHSSAIKSKRIFVVKNESESSAQMKDISQQKWTNDFNTDDTIVSETGAEVKK